MFFSFLLLFVFVSWCSGTEDRFPPTPPPSVHEHLPGPTEFEVAYFKNRHSLGKPVTAYAQLPGSFFVTPLSVGPQKTNLTIRWSGIPNPDINDMIAIFSPPAQPGSPPPKALFGQRLANASASYMQGYGSINWQLIPMRYNYEFRYYGMGPNGEWPILKAVSEQVQVNPQLALQGHLSLTHNESEMRLVWVSGTGAGETSPKGMVRWGESPTGDLPYSAMAEPSTYTLDQLEECQRDTYATLYWRDPGTIFKVVMDGLIPDGRQYYYEYGWGDDWSARHSFRSAQSSDRAEETNMLVFGDMGTMTGCTEALAGWCEVGAHFTLPRLYDEARRSDVIWDAVLHIGDISYATGRAARWDQFHWDIEPIATKIPYMAINGNHESDHTNQKFQPFLNNYGNDSHGECTKPFAARFPMPERLVVESQARQGRGKLASRREPTSADAPWWSADIGLVHVIAFSSEHDFFADSPQFAWAEQDLALVDRSRTPFVVAVMHREMYASMVEPNQWIMSMYLQRHIEPLLVKHRVDALFFGHIHATEVTCPIVGSECNTQDGVVNYLVGHAGMGLTSGFSPDPPSWSLFRANTFYGYSRLRATRKTMTVEIINANTGEVAFTNIQKVKFF